MLKAAGAWLILLGTLLGGYSQVCRLRQRTRLLGELRQALARVKAEVRFRSAGLGEIFEALGSLAESGGFFQQWAVELERAPERVNEETVRQLARERLAALNEEERQTLAALGAVLGRYDTESQFAALEQAERKLERFEQTAREEQKRLGRVYMALSAALGAGVVLICL